MSDCIETIRTCPISKLYHNMPSTTLKYFITHLEEIRYRIHCVVSDNNAVNRNVIQIFQKPTLWLSSHSYCL